MPKVKSQFYQRPSGWAQRFGNFRKWLERTGVDVLGLPSWDDETPVRVISIPGLIFIRRMSIDEYARCLEGTQGRCLWLVACTADDVADMVRLNVVDIDTDKLDSRGVS